MERIIKFSLTEIFAVYETTAAHHKDSSPAACRGGQLSIYLEDINKAKPVLVAACSCGWRKLMPDKEDHRG